MFAPETRPLAGMPHAAPGFNEAGACLPRKLGTVVPGHASHAGFNEAGACLPRKRAAPCTPWSR